MVFRVWLKARFADKVLLPIREALINQIPSGSTVMDIGCGTGDLLFKCAPKLLMGYGVDIDEAMINYAQDRCRKENINNIQFTYSDIRNATWNDCDIATSTLCLHELDVDTACEILRIMVKHSKKVLIADYTGASTLAGKVGIELDEMVSGHYRYYRQYKNRGEVSFYANKIGAIISKTVATKIDGISIWVIEGSLKG